MRPAIAVFATALSVAAFALAFPPFRISPLAFVCLAPFFVAVRSVGSRWVAPLGLLWGYLGSLLIADALPASVETYFLQSALVSWAFSLGVLTVTAALFYAAFALAYRALAGRTGRALPLLAAAAWVVMEWGRVRYPWGLIGYTQVGFDPLMQIASLGGIHAVGFVVVLFNAAVADLWLARARPDARRRAAWGLALASVPALAAIAWGSVVLGAADRESGRGEPVPVAVVQANLDLGSQWRVEFYGRNLDEQLAMTGDAAAGGIAIWSESSLTFHLDREPVFRKRIADVLAARRLELVVGGPSSRGRTPDYFNSVFAMDSDGVLRGRYDKQILVPFAEFVPFAGFDPMRRSFDGARSFSPGGATAPLPTRAGPAGVLVCNEGMIPGLARSRVLEGASWLVSPSNDSWIAKDRWADLTFDLVSVRAIEQRRYLVRASSSGPSGIVDPWGRVLARTGPRSRALLRGEIRRHDERTPYARIGDLPVLLCALAVAGALLSVCATRLRASRGPSANEP